MNEDIYIYIEREREIQRGGRWKEGGREREREGVMEGETETEIEREMG